MKAIFTIAIAIFAATFTFANNGNPTKGAPATTATVATVATVENNDATAEMTSAMDAVLGNLITNNILATTSTTMDNATILTITSNEITISNRFAVHNFNETTSDNITPAAPAMEVITLDAEEM